MEAIHTSGPWEFRVYDGKCTIVSRHDKPGSTVRDRLKGVSITVDASIRDDQSNAHTASPDAHLLKSAPELLAFIITLQLLGKREAHNLLVNHGPELVAKAGGRP